MSHFNHHSSAAVIQLSWVTELDVPHLTTKKREHVDIMCGKQNKEVSVGSKLSAGPCCLFCGSQTFCSMGIGCM